MSFSKTKLVATLAGVALISLTCARSDSEGVFKLSSDKGEPVAKIGDITVSVESMAEKYNRSVPFWKDQLTNSPEKQKELVDSYVTQILLAKEGIKRGFLSDPETKEQIIRILAQKTARALMEDSKGPTKLTDEQLKAYYDQHQTDFNRPEKIKVSYIFMPYGADKQKTLTHMKTAQRRAQDTKDPKNKNFGDLVKEFSSPETQGTAQEANPTAMMDKTELAAKFGEPTGEALFTTDSKKNLSAVLEGKDGYYLFKTLGRQEAFHQEFEQAKQTIERRMTSEARKEFYTKSVEQMRAGAGVTIYTDKISKIVGSGAAKADKPAEPKKGS